MIDPIVYEEIASDSPAAYRSLREMRDAIIELQKGYLKILNLIADGQLVVKKK